MQAICLEHHTCDSMLFQFNMPYPHRDGSGYVRACDPMRATPGFSYKDILKEVAEKGPDDYLDSVTIVVHWYVVSMTVSGFLRIANNFHHEDQADANPEQRKANLARELVASRDYYLNGGQDRKDHKQWDYWPKD